MDFGIDEKVKQKINTSFRLSHETIAQIDYCVDKRNKDSNCNINFNRTKLIEYLIYNELSESERTDIRDKLRTKKE